MRHYYWTSSEINVCCHELSYCEILLGKALPKYNHEKKYTKLKDVMNIHLVWNMVIHQYWKAIVVTCNGTPNHHTSCNNNVPLQNIDRIKVLTTWTPYLYTCVIRVRIISVFVAARDQFASQNIRILSRKIAYVD